MQKKSRRFILSSLLAISCLSLAACGGSSGSSTTPAPDTSGSSQVTTLQTIDTVTGTGAIANAGNIVTVNYTGWLYNAGSVAFHGSQFDTSVGKSPFTFQLGAGSVIRGWDQGVVGMRVGGKRTLIIPSSLGYGASGTGPIPPNAALVFDVELISVK